LNGIITTPRGIRYNLNELKINGQKIKLSPENLDNVAHILYVFFKETGLLEKLNQYNIKECSFDENGIQLGTQRIQLKSFYRTPYNTHLFTDEEKSIFFKAIRKILLVLKQKKKLVKKL